MSSSSLGATALHEPWPPVLFASTGLYPELFFCIRLSARTQLIIFGPTANINLEALSTHRVEMTIRGMFGTKPIRGGVEALRRLDCDSLKPALGHINYSVRILFEHIFVLCIFSFRICLCERVISHREVMIV
jgi:hypothetical protein